MLFLIGNMMVRGWVTKNARKVEEKGHFYENAKKGEGHNILYSC